LTFAFCFGEQAQFDISKLLDYENDKVKPLHSSLSKSDYNFDLNDSNIHKYELLDISKDNRLSFAL